MPRTARNKVMVQQFGKYRGSVPKEIQDAMSKDRELFEQIALVYVMGWRMCQMCNNMTAKPDDPNEICPQCRGVRSHDCAPESDQYGAVYVMWRK